MTSRPSPAEPLRIKPTTVTVAILLVLTAVAYSFKDALYLWISGATAASDSLGRIAALATEPGLVALVVLTAVVTLWAWLRNPLAFWRLACGGVGVILAYLASEGLKLLVIEQRPCRALDVVTVLACPEVGDWSWPSNHSVIAAAFATTCVFAVPRLIWFVAPGAALIGLSRVAVGAHYPHDVLAGLALGILMVLFCVTALRPVAYRLAAASSEKNLTGRSRAE